MTISHFIQHKPIDCQTFRASQLSEDFKETTAPYVPWISWLCVFLVQPCVEMSALIQKM